MGRGDSFAREECLVGVYCFAFSAASPRLNRAQRDKQERSLLASKLRFALHGD